MVYKISYTDRRAYVTGVCTQILHKLLVFRYKRYKQKGKYTVRNFLTNFQIMNVKIV